jgi:hypothetical protein
VSNISYNDAVKDFVSGNFSVAYEKIKVLAAVGDEEAEDLLCIMEHANDGDPRAKAMIELLKESGKNLF